MVPGLFHLKKSLVVFVDTGLRNVGFNITFFFFLILSVIILQQSYDINVIIVHF